MLFTEKIKSYKGAVIFGPRCFSLTETQSLTPPKNSPIRELFNTRVSFVESLPLQFRGKIFDSQNNAEFEYSRWREDFEDYEGKAGIVFENGCPAVISKGNLHYLGFFPGRDFLCAFLRSALPKDFHLPAEKMLPEGVRKTRLGNLTFYLNFGREDHTIKPEETDEILVGETTLGSMGVTILKNP